VLSISDAATLACLSFRRLMIAKYRIVWIALLGGVAIAASVALALAASPAIRTYGTIQQLVAEHDVVAKVALADVLSTPHAYGLGSLSHLRGEITILDGQVWVAYRPVLPGDGPRVISGEESLEEAGFLVATNIDPDHWRSSTIEVGFTSETLQSLMQQLAAKNGLSGTDVPFRIDGRFSTLTLAIVDGRKLPAGPLSPEQLQQANYLETETEAAGTLVGFMSPSADGRFTHAGMRIHVHAVVPSRRATGHAQTFKVAPGATLWLPIPDEH
jgi:alpha-acetolactate decarboxylase